MSRNNNVEYWLVQLGYLFYTSGLFRMPTNEHSFSYEFTKDEKVAFCFMNKETARNIASHCGGDIIQKQCSSEEFHILTLKRALYLDSENQWIRGQDEESYTCNF